MTGPRLFTMILCMAGSVFFASCSVFFGDDEKAIEEKEAEEVRVPDTLMRSFVRTAHDPQGRILWQIKAREGRVFNDLNRIYLTDFILYSFAEDGSLRSTFRARRGVMDNNTGITTGKIKVVLRAENGRVLETTEVHANNNDKIIYNDVLNKITQEDGTVMIGTHLWAHSDLKVFKLRGTKGEAPEGAEGGLFGEEGSSAASRSATPSSQPARFSSAGAARSREGTGDRSSSSRAATGPEGSHGSSSSVDARTIFPDLGFDELERLRMEIAFPASRAAASSASSSTVSSTSSSGSRSSSVAPVVGEKQP